LVQERSLIPFDNDVPQHHLVRPVETGYVSEAPSQDAQLGGMNILRILAKRWPIAFLLAIIISVPSVYGVWKYIKPEYTVRSHIKITPVIKPLVYEEGEDKIPYYRQYVNTAAMVITSENVLDPMLRDPSVKNMPFVKRPDVIEYIKGMMRARGSKMNQLLSITMTGEDPRMITKVVNATVRQYMKDEYQKRIQFDDSHIRGLEREKQAALQEVKQYDGHIAQMAKLLDYGWGNFDEQERKMIESAQADQERRASLQSQRISLQMQLELAKKNTPTSATAPIELLKIRMNYVQTDPLVAALSNTVTRLKADIVLNSGVYREDTLEMRQLNKRLKAAEEGLEVFTEKALDKFREMLLLENKQKQQFTIEAIESRLKEMDRREKLIDERLAKKSEKIKLFSSNRLAIDGLKADKLIAQHKLNRIKKQINILTTERNKQFRFEVIESARIPRNPSDDKRLVMCAAVIVGSLVIGFAFVVLISEMDKRVESPDDVEKRYGLHVLGTTPRLKDLDRQRIQPRHFVDDCRTIRVNLALASGVGADTRCIVVASPEGRDGKTMLAINLATSIALTGKRVVLVDGDLRKPDIARYLRVNNSLGITNVLTGECELDDAIRSTQVPSLKILPCNRTKGRRGEILLSSGLKQLIQDLRERFDEIIVDTPAMLAMPDAALWGSVSDGIMLVSRSGKTGGKRLNMAVARLRRSGVKVLGIVLTGVRMKDSYEKYHQRYQAGYFDAPLTEEEWNATQVFLLSKEFDDQDTEAIEAPEEESTKQLEQS